MTDKSNKIKPWSLILLIIPIAIFIGMISFFLYKDNIIFPPDPPTSAYDTKGWSSSEIYRLRKYLGCGKLPSFSSDTDIKKMRNYCNILLKNLNRAYRIEDEKEFKEKHKEQFEKIIKE